MTRALRFGIGSVLLLATIGLLGYTAYTVQNRIAALESELEYFASQRLTIRQFEQARHAKLYAAILEPENQALLQSIVDEEDMELRRSMFGDLTDELFGRAGPFSVPSVGGFDNTFLSDFNLLVDYSELEDRTYILGRINEKARMDGGVEEPMVIVEDTSWFIGEISSMATALGGLASGVLSFMVFFRGGGARKLEEEMLALDIELKRIEVAKARFAARDVLGSGAAK